MATDLCLALLKYSYATGQSDNGAPWTHLRAQNMFVIVRGKNTQIPDGQLVMRIVQGSSVLVGFAKESVDVASYVDTAGEARRSAHQIGITLQTEQLPIFAIAKESVLALRYRLQDGQARRIQLRMQNPAECRRVVDTFVRRGMEFIEQRPPAARLETARPGTDSSQSRMLTASGSSSHSGSYRTAEHPPSLQSPAIDAGSLSRGGLLGVSHTKQHFDERFPTRDAANLDMPPPRLFTRDEIAAPREISPSRPTTAHIYRSAATPSHQPETRAYDQSSSTLRGSSSRPASPVRFQALESGCKANDGAPHRTAFEMPPTSLAAMHSPQTWTSTKALREDSGLVSSDSAEPRRPTARLLTPATGTYTCTLEPNQHDVSLNKPPSRPSRSAAGSRPSSSTLSLPPLPKPKLVKESSDSPMREAELSPLKRASQARPNTVSPLKRKLDDTTPAPTMSLLEQGDALSHAPALRPSRTEELLRRPLTELSTNIKAARVSSLLDADHELESPSAPSRSAATTREGAASPAKVMSITRDATASPLNDTVSNRHEVSLEQYASQSLEERAATLDQFMVEHLEHPAFITLCEDVENCWRRIALGL